MLAGAQIGVNVTVLRIDAGRNSTESNQPLKFATATVTQLNTNAKQNGWVWLGASSTQPPTLFYAEKLGHEAKALNTPALMPANWTTSPVAGCAMEERRTHHRRPALPAAPGRDHKVPLIVMCMAGRPAPSKTLRSSNRMARWPGMGSAADQSPRQHRIWRVLRSGEQERPRWCRLSRHHDGCGCSHRRLPHRFEQTWLDGLQLWRRDGRLSWKARPIASRPSSAAHRSSIRRANTARKIRLLVRPLVLRKPWEHASDAWRQSPARQCRPRQDPFPAAAG